MTRDRKDAEKRGVCCMVSEFLEETGIDRATVRRVRRQVLEGIILVCRWQLDRMEQDRAPAPERPRKGRRITVE